MPVTALVISHPCVSRGINNYTHTQRESRAIIFLLSNPSFYNYLVDGTQMLTKENKTELDFQKILNISFPLIPVVTKKTGSPGQTRF